MPSQAMQDSIDALRERRKASAGQAPPTLEQRRAAFIPGDRLYPVPDDVRVTEVTAGGVPAHWLAAPGTDPGRVLLFLHGGGYEFGSVRSDGELAARLGRAAGMRVLFPEYRLAPEHPFPAAIDDVLAAWRWLRTGQDLSARSLAVAGDSAGGGLATALLVATRDAGQALPAAAVLMSPTVDLTSSGASMTERADQDPISTPAMLRQFAAGYLAGAGARVRFLRITMAPEELHPDRYQRRRPRRCPRAATGAFLRWEAWVPGGSVLQEAGPRLPRSSHPHLPGRRDER